MQADSLNISSDSVPVDSVLIEKIDTTQKPSEDFIAPDTSHSPEPKLQSNTLVIPKAVKIETLESDSSKELAVDSIQTEIVSHSKPFILFPNLNSTDSSLVKLPNKHLKQFQSQSIVKLITPKELGHQLRMEKGWVLGLTLAVLLILIIVRNYYQKYLSTIITSAINIQLSEKLLREKNVLVRRVFFLLNTSFVVVLGLYFYQLVKRFEIQKFIENDFLLFLFIFFILAALIVIRLAVARLIAIVFDAGQVFREYIHNIFIINKNLGIYLLPVIISIFYVKTEVSNYLFVLATIMILISLIYRYIRAIQIILKHNVFLFYSILYLCTLEILPVLIGIKFVLTQR